MQKFSKTLLAFFIILGFTYGASFQQFLHFSWEDPRGLDDAPVYLTMSHGDFNVSQGHRYRIIVPLLADLVRQAIQPMIPSNQLPWPGGIDALSFFVVNGIITSLAGLFLYLFLIKLKFDTKLSFLGVFIFLGSRSIIMSTGGPIVDSLYYLSIIIIVYLCLAQRTLLLSLLNPFLILTKETTVPFLFLPLVLKMMNRKLILLSLTISFVVLFQVRGMISAKLPDVIASSDPIWNILLNHLAAGKENILQSYFSFAGLHSLFSTFSIFWLFAALGAWLDYKKRVTQYEIPHFLLWMVPVTFGFTLLSANSGRMLFSLFPLVIPYSLIGMDFLISQKPANDSSEKPKPGPEKIL